jgi:hypothetical protein
VTPDAGRPRLGTGAGTMTDRLTDDDPHDITEAEEVAAFLTQLLPDVHPGSVAKRRHDLVVDGDLGDSGRTRITRFGSAAIVWVIS